MIILGIDPGLSVTGYGVIRTTGRNPLCLGFGGIYTPGTDTLAKKLEKIFDGICEVILKYVPEECAVENIFYHENVKTAIVMGHARGVVMLAAQKSRMPVFEYSPREVKMSTVGIGSASKQQVSAMVKTILQLSETPKPHDAADALAVALCHHHRMKMNRLINESR